MSFCCTFSLGGHHAIYYILRLFVSWSYVHYGITRLEVSSEQKSKVYRFLSKFLCHQKFHTKDELKTSAPLSMNKTCINWESGYHPSHFQMEKQSKNELLNSLLWFDQRPTPSLPCFPYDDSLPCQRHAMAPIKPTTTQKST